MCLGNKSVLKYVRFTHVNWIFWKCIYSIKQTFKIHIYSIYAAKNDKFIFSSYYFICISTTSILNEFLIYLRIKGEKWCEDLTVWNNEIKRGENDFINVFHIL